MFANYTASTTSLDFRPQKTFQTVVFDHHDRDLFFMWSSKQALQSGRGPIQIGNHPSAAPNRLHYRHVDSFHLQ